MKPKVRSNVSHTDVKPQGRSKPSKLTSKLRASNSSEQDDSLSDLEVFDGRVDSDFDLPEDPDERELLRQKIRRRKRQLQRKKNENILCAIMALMKDLDKSGLEFVKSNAQKKIEAIDQKI